MKRGGMDAVIEKTSQAMDGMPGRRKPMLKRKPGLAVMIAVGKPKGPPPGRGPMQEMEDEEEEDGMEDTMPDRPDPEILLAKIRLLTKRLDKLEAQLNGESDGEMEDEEMEED
jgi:hypothetical protein